MTEYIYVQYHNFIITEKEAQRPEKKESRCRQYTCGQDKELPAPLHPNPSSEIQKQDDNDPYEACTHQPLDPDYKHIIDTTYAIYIVQTL
jgi:hypothetical protein